MTDFALLHDDAASTLQGWHHDEPGQRALRDAFLAFLGEHPDAMSRECRAGHLTSSALVMDEDRSRVLLTLHPKVGRWLQLGGHNEPGDAGIRAAARREAVEESGIADMAVSEAPIRLDRHPVPCGGRMSEHLDVQFLALVPTGSREAISEESLDLRWFAVDALPDPLDDAVRAMIDTALRGSIRVD